jgi:DNA (cytosine-5)-methyltransferase 1
MRYGSVCSGVEAASLAWEPLGWECAFVSEIEKFPAAVLAHHYPNVPNLGDMTAHDFADRCLEQGPINVLVGGTPCQSFSVAGLRGGLDDERGNLALEFCRLTDRLAPTWVVWENVPGVLSSSKGRDFGSIVGALGQLGYNLAWRILDAQNFGVPQRRRRVFLVGHLGADERGAAAVLFEQHCLQGHPAPSREARQDLAPTVSAGPPFSRTGNERVEAQELVPTVANTLGNRGTRSHTEIDGHGAYVPMLDSETAQTLNKRDYKGPSAGRDGVVGNPIALCVNARETPVSASGAAVAFAENQRGELRTSEVMTNINVNGGKPCPGFPAVLQPMQVRRLTPRECERLQGMPDDWTKIPWRKKDAEDCPDGPRYKAIGNSMAVPVMRWIGERIAMVEEIYQCKR